MHNYDDESGITVGELIEELKLFPKDAPICFGQHGHFTFYRVKDRGNIAQIEFNEIEYTLREDHHYSQHLRSIGSK